MKIQIPTLKRRSFLARQGWRGYEHRVVLTTDGFEDQCSVPSEYWPLIAKHWHNECERHSWGHGQVRPSDDKVLEFDDIEPYRMLSGLFGAISGPVGLDSKIFSQKQRQHLVETFIDTWFAEKLYEHNALAMSHDQIGQRWIDAIPALAVWNRRHRLVAADPIMTPWLADKIRAKTAANRGEHSSGRYFRWITHEGPHGITAFAAHFDVQNKAAIAIGPIFSTQALMFGITRKPTTTEERNALNFLLQLSGMSADAVLSTSPQSTILLEDALRATASAAVPKLLISDLAAA